MLPPNFLTIPQIQNERQAGSKLMYLTTLLEYLLKLYNPNVTAAEAGKDPKVGERVITHRLTISKAKATSNKRRAGLRSSANWMPLI